MDKSNDDIKAPILNLNDLATLEDDLKPEYELFNNLTKSIDSVKKHSKNINDENSELVKTMEKLKINLSGELSKKVVNEEVNWFWLNDLHLPDALDSKRSLEEQLKKQKSDKSAHIDSNLLLVSWFCWKQWKPDVIFLYETFWARTTEMILTPICHANSRKCDFELLKVFFAFDRVDSYHQNSWCALLK